MGKGDKKSRRGKIILGTYGVRRPRQKAAKATEKKAVVSKTDEVKERKPLKERKEVREVKEVKEIAEPRSEKDT